MGSIVSNVIWHGALTETWHFAFYNDQETIISAEYYVCECTSNRIDLRYGAGDAGAALGARGPIKSRPEPYGRRPKPT